MRGHFVSDDIEVHFGEEPGYLRLDCGAQAFEEIRDAVFKSGRLTGMPDLDPDDVFEVHISCYEADRPDEPSLSKSLWQLGCALIAFALLAVFVIGVITIVGWFKPPA